MRYPAPTVSDPLSVFIYKFLKNAGNPLETGEVVGASMDAVRHSSRSAVLYRLRLLQQAGKVKGKQLSTGPWVWWI